MKRILMTVLAVTGFVLLAQGQSKMGFVDSEYILKHIPEYISAQKQIDDLSEQWQKESDQKFAEIEKMYKAYQAEQVLLSDEMRRRREQEIVDKERAAKDFQKEKFGYDGELFQRRKELIKPIQDKVYEAVQKVAEESGFGILFDKSSDLIMLYSSPKLDKSDAVVLKMGYKPGEFAGTTNTK